MEVHCEVNDNRCHRILPVDVVQTKKYKRIKTFVEIVDIM